MNDNLRSASAYWPGGVGPSFNWTMRSGMWGSYVDDPQAPGWKYESDGQGGYRVVDPTGKKTYASPGSSAAKAIEQRLGVSQAPSDPIGLFSSIVTSAKGGNKQQALALAAQGVAKYGPDVVEAAAEVWSTRRDSLASLQKRLAKKQAAYAAAKNQKHKIKLAYQIRALQAQIAEAQKTVAEAKLTADTPMPVAPDGGQDFPSWMPMAIIGGVVIVGAMLLLGGKSKKAA